MTIDRRVAILRSELLPISETFIRDQARALTSWKPILIGRKNIPGGLETPGIQREIVPEANGRLLRALRYWLWRPDPSLVNRLRQMDVALAHAHFGVDATDFWPSVKAAGLPMLVTLHGYDINIHRWWWERGHGGLRRRVYPRRLLKMAQDSNVRFVAVSEAIKHRAIEQGIPEDKITISHIGVDTDQFKPGNVPITQRCKRIIFVGRMVENKAPLLMIHVFSEIRKKIPEAELVMIGDGDLLKAAKEISSNMRLDIDFTGAILPTEVARRMIDARVLCLPSITIESGASEAFGLVLLEAQSCGVPVVTSSKGGKDGLINGLTGIFFKEGDSIGMARGIERFLVEKDFADFASAKAREFVKENFDVHVCIKKVEKIYNEIAIKYNLSEEDSIEP